MKWCLLYNAMPFFGLLFLGVFIDFIGFQELK